VDDLGEPQQDQGWEVVAVNTSPALSSIGNAKIHFGEFSNGLLAWKFSTGCSYSLHRMSRAVTLSLARAAEVAVCTQCLRCCCALTSMFDLLLYAQRTWPETVVRVFVRPRASTLRPPIHLASAVTQ
jgi:hypothetical protein